MITFDRTDTTEAELKRGIETLGYGVEPPPTKMEEARVAAPAENFAMPPDAPAFFREAVARATKAGKPLLVDFWAPWCAPCVKLKRETLESPYLATLLEKFQVIAVNLDETPSLGKFYGVSSIPYVLFVDSKGKVADRLMGFELPAVFELRLRKALPREEQPLVR
jgi:thioredoxin-like negative regulator of GroEL